MKNVKVVRQMVGIVLLCSVLECSVGWVSAFPATAQVISHIATESGVHRISVDHDSHEDYGLAYPVTYRFSIPAGYSTLQAYRRHRVDEAWSPLAEMISQDLFNGVECVRFDYENNYAYISVGFADGSDDIYVKITDSDGEDVETVYMEICEYYDNRKATAVITADDWNNATHPSFNVLCNMSREAGVWLTVGVITNWNGPPVWSDIQAQLDAGYVEVASHSRTHVYPSEDESEVIGSRDDILANLTMPAHYRKGDKGYVPAWIEPGCQATALSAENCAKAKYLCDRACAWYNGIFGKWVHGQLYRGVVPSILSNCSAEGADVVVKADFDARYAAGEIFHLQTHPYPMNETREANFRSILDHIGGRNDVWYVGLGALYMYHFVQERGMVEVNPPHADFTATPTSGIAPLTVEFTDQSAGSIDLWSWDLDGDGSVDSTERNPTHAYDLSGAYTVSLSVSNAVASDTETKVEYILVYAPPQADFSASATVASEGQVIAFIDESTGDVTSWSWDFDGDGSVDSTERNPSFTYANPGRYTVSLTVEGPAGSDAEVKSDFVNVSAHTGGQLLVQQTISPGSAAGVQTEDARIVLEFPAGATTGTAVVSIIEESRDSVPSCPSGFRAGATCFSIELAGDLAPGAMVTITVHYSDADLETCGGNPSLLTLARYDTDAGKWVDLPTTVDTAAQTLTARTDRFSKWMVLAAEPAEEREPAETAGSTGHLWIWIVGGVAGLLVLAQVVSTSLWLRRRLAGPS